MSRNALKRKYSTHVIHSRSDATGNIPVDMFDGASRLLSEDIRVVGHRNIQVCLYGDKVQIQVVVTGGSVVPGGDG